MEFSELRGKTLVDVRIVDIDQEVHFYTDDGKKYHLYHDQDCCESVVLDDVCGDLAHLIGEPILMADERTNSNTLPPLGADESWMWTFYEIATIKGAVTLRWFGQSNGYYSESVDFREIK